MLGFTVRSAPMGDPAVIVPRQLARGATEAVLLLDREVTVRTPIGVTEAARGSIVHQVEPLGRGDVIGRVGSPLPHVQVLDRGRRPGAKMPPPDELELWVRRKFRIEVPRKRGGGVRRRAPTVDEAASIAWLIARAIGHRGLKPHEMFSKAIAENESNLSRIFGGVGLEITRDFSGGRR